MIKVNTIKEAVQTAAVFLATALVVATLTSCENNNDIDRYRYQLEGEWAVDFVAYEDNGNFFDGVDTVFTDLCVVRFLEDKMITYKYTDPNYFVRESIPELGMMYEQYNEFEVEYINRQILITLDINGQSVGEMWWFDPEAMTLTREYLPQPNFDVHHIHTMNLKEI